MPETLTPHLALFAGGLLAAMAAIGWIVTRRETIGNAMLAGALAAGFAGFTAVTIAAEGVVPVIANHTSNLWGVQVWWDLLFALSIAFFFAVSRARAAGMNIPFWTLFILATASIGLLAMCARLFWLEHRLARSAAA